MFTKNIHSNIHSLRYIALHGYISHSVNAGISKIGGFILIVQQYTLQWSPELSVKV